MPRPAIADYPAGAHVATRVIDDYEIVWLLRGRARFILTGRPEPRPLNGEHGRAFALEPGVLLLIPPGVRHSFAWDRQRPTRHGYLHFEPTDVTGRPPDGVRVRKMTGDDPLAGLCAHLLWLGLDPHRRHDAIRRTLSFLVALVTEGPLPGRRPPPTVPRALDASIRLLRTAWADPPLRRISVDELAAAATVSRGYFTRIFRAEFGLTPAAALDALRCLRAEALLTHTDLTVQTIAHLCGFTDPSHFTHRFSATHGQPPSTFRSSGGQNGLAGQNSGQIRLSRLIFDDDHHGVSGESAR
jgi:AraC-like DNA-binding protein